MSNLQTEVKRLLPPLPPSIATRPRALPLFPKQPPSFHPRPHLGLLSTHSPFSRGCRSPSHCATRDTGHGKLIHSRKLLVDLWGFAQRGSPGGGNAAKEHPGITTHMPGDEEFGPKRRAPDPPRPSRAPPPPRTARQERLPPRS